MTSTHDQSASHLSHLNALRARHASLSSRIDEELRHPAMNDITLKRLKRERLQLKDTIEQFEQDG